jgi:hypothetical protein
MKNSPQILSEILVYLYSIDRLRNFCLTFRSAQTHTTTQFSKWNRVDPRRGNCGVGSDSDQPRFRRKRNSNKVSYIFPYLFSNETKWLMSIVPKMRSTTILLIRPGSTCSPSPNSLFQLTLKLWVHDSFYPPTTWRFHLIIVFLTRCVHSRLPNSAVSSFVLPQSNSTPTSGKFFLFLFTLDALENCSSGI